MRCASCNVVVEPLQIATGALRCVCGAELELPDARPRPGERPPPVERLAPRAAFLLSYRTAVGLEAPTPPVVELAGVGRELLCPRCRTPLSYAFKGTYDVQECKRCFGAFVDATALEIFIDEARAAQRSEPSSDRKTRSGPAVPEESPARCPSCPMEMMRTEFGRRSGILVDVCRTHGTWFDAGELARVLAFAAASRPEPVDQGREGFLDSLNRSR